MITQSIRQAYGPNEGTSSGEGSWLDAPPGRRALLLVLAPRFAAALLALVVLGPARTLAATVVGVPQLFAGFGAGRPLLQRATEVLAHEGWLTLFAVAMCKALSFSMLNLPFDFVQGIATRSMESAQKTIAKIRAVVLFATLALMVAWLVTWVRWAFF